MFGPPPPVVDGVAGWQDIEIIFARLEERIGPQPEIAAARLALSDVDGDGKFFVAELGFLVESMTWAIPYADPLALYVADVQADDTLTEAGKQARIIAAQTIRDSLVEILG